MYPPSIYCSLFYDILYLMKKYLFSIGLFLCLFINNIIQANALPVMKANYKPVVSTELSTLSTEIMEHEPVSDDPAQTNLIPNWPTGPDLNCKAAILYEANTGVILYAKNIHSRLYPASTTKIMTALLAAEHSNMNDRVKFSHDAVFSLEPGSSNIGIDPGQELSMEECLYGLMVGSANEVANAIAEYVGGSMDGFVDMMNDKVKELGLQNTHFMNTNGLHNEEHYTSAYDLAIIAREFFNNDKLARIGNTASYHFEPTATQPDDFYIRNKHKLVNGDIPYTGMKGGKTGYTSSANETLVSCAEQNSMRLICVILYEDSPEQFNDTVKLFDYGFSNFGVVNVSENETRYSIKSSNFFPTTVDILGKSKQILELNEDNYIIMPKNLIFNELETELDYDVDNDKEVAKIYYSYHGAYLGYGCVERNDNIIVTSAFDPELTTKEEEKEEVEDTTIYINVVTVITYVAIISVSLIIVSLIISVLINYNILDNIREKKKGRRKVKRIKNDIRF